MKVFTKVVFEWRGDELVQTESESYEYEGPVDLCKGGGGPKNYENLERLYGIQADQAQFLGETFKGTVAPAYKRWLADTEDYGSQANQELAAERAGKAASGATSQAQQSLQADLASYGINPADQRYAQGMREMGIQGAAQQAGAETQAREGIKDKGFARMQDVIGMGMGTPTQAAQAANSAANAATSSLTAQNQAQQNQANSVGNVVRAGTNVWGMYNQDQGSGRYADGGQVQKQGILRLKQGGYVQRLARGGFAGQGTGGAGFMGGPQVQAPPPSVPAAPSQAGAATAAAANPLTLRAGQQIAGKGIEMGGTAANSPGATAFGRGLQMSPGQANAAADVYNKAATEVVDKAMGIDKFGAADFGSGAGSGNAAQVATTPLATDAAAAVPTALPGATATELGMGGVEAATAAPIAEAAVAPAATELALGAGAEGLAASGAGLAAAGTLGAAIPVIGGGLALYGIGNAAGWWADGGEVGPGSRQQTGEVDGPGGPKDDEIIAALSDGEFVMPKGVVNFYGIKHLENMRKKGLEYEKQMGIG